MTKLITSEDKKTVIDMMTAAGWEYCDHSKSDLKIFGGDFSLFFTIPLSKDDLNKTMKRIGKNHFTPDYGYRSVSLFTRYATSDIRGTYRDYRCRNSYQTDVSNIFAYVKDDNIVEHAREFLKAYDNLEYNIR